MEMRTANFISQFKTREENNKKIISGYFIVYNQPVELWHNYFEEIAPEACAESLNNNDIRALYNHDTSFVLGRSTAGTLLIRNDSYGVYGEIEVNPNDSEALNIYERVKRGDITGCSFGFYPTDEEYIRVNDTVTKCIIKKADVREISVCPFPAYPQTQIIARQQDFGTYQKKYELELKKNRLKERLKNG